MSNENHPDLGALERLAELYDKGLLTREEFDHQKAAILAGPALTQAPQGEGPEAPLQAPAADPARPTRRAPVVLLVSAAIAVAAVGAVFWMLWSRRPPAGPSAATNTAAMTPAMTAATPAATPAAPPPTLDQAFALVFGAKGKAVKTLTWQHYPIQVRYAPQKLVPITGGLALIARGDVVNAAHVNSGFLGIAYLTPGPAGWTVSGQWPQFVETGSFGEIDKWKRRDDLFDSPGLEVDGGGEWQGCAVDYADLVELTPGKPTLRAGNVLVSFSYARPQNDEEAGLNDAGDGQGPQYGETNANIVADVKGQSFKAIYDGDFGRTVTYRRGPVVFRPSPNAKGLPGC